jgi:neutral amino acid transport system permease protein
MDISELFGFSLQQALGPTAIIYCLAAIGLNVHFGYTGLLNFGQAGFMLVAGYSIGGAVTIFSSSLWIGLVVGLLLCVVLALLLGVPTLRLRADYLAIVTIAAAEIIRQTVSAASFSDTFGGQDGITDYIGGFRTNNPYDDRIGIPGLVTWGANDFWVMTVGWSVVALCCVLVWLLMRSPWGRVLKSIREDEDAVRSLGKNVYAYKMQSLVLGGVIGAVAGIVYVMPRAVQPDSMGRPMTFFVWTILLLGGAATVFGPVLGSMIFWAALMLIKSVMRSTVPPEVMRTEQIEQFGWIVVGVTLMLLVIFRPQGVLGDKKELAINVR